MAETQETTKEILDTIEDTLDVIENSAQVVKNNKPLIFAVAVLSLGGGIAVGYSIAKRRLVKKYDEISRNEIAEARAYYERNLKPATPQQLAANYNAQVVEESSSEDEDDDEEPDIRELRALTRNYSSASALVETKEKVTEKVVRNVFEVSDPGTDNFDYEEELKTRSEDRPYIISHDEFMAGEKDYQQTSLTYYEGDDVLTDDKDQTIDDTGGTVGNDNLLKFGYGSKDNNIVYIRNDKLTLEFEVIRHHGKYVEQVLGFIEHSDNDRRPRKFRNHDD